jgi:malonyl-CoA O-methyltransferase
MNKKKWIEELLEARIPEKYAMASALQREVLKEIFLRLEFITLQPETILDVGCATGDSIILLKKHYPNARIVATETSADMLDYAKNHLPDHAAYLLSKPHALPVPDHSVDLLMANLVLPWCDDESSLMREWRRVLRPDGLLIFASLGPDTLRELHHLPLAFPHLMDMHTIGDLLMQAGFQHPVLDVDYLTLTWTDQNKMWDELKVTGMIAGNVERIQLEKTDDRYALSHEIIFAHAFAPALNTGHVPDEKGEIRIPLSDVLRRPR